jgi:hypothetical protein
LDAGLAGAALAALVDAAFLAGAAAFLGADFAMRENHPSCPADGAD